MDELLTELRTAEENRRLAERHEAKGHGMVAAATASPAVQAHGRRTVEWAGRMARSARRELRRVTAAVFADPPGGSE